MKKNNKMKKILIAIIMVLSLMPIYKISIKATGQQAEIAGVRYDTLQEAVNHGGNIKLINDIYLDNTVEIAEDRFVSIDLNGYNITVYQNSETGRSLYALNNYGTLTLLDSKKQGSITARGIQNLKNGRLTINSGAIISCDSNGGAAIWNEANLIVNGGTFTTSYVGTSSDLYGAGCLNNSGNAYITGGSFQSVNKRTYAIVSSSKIEITPEQGKQVLVHGTHGGLGIDAGTGVINGGSYSSTEYYGLYVSNDGVGLEPTKATVIVNGGSFNGAHSVYIGSDINDPVNSTIEINGGYFQKSLYAEPEAGAFAMLLKGGTFVVNPGTAFLAQGYKVYEQESQYVVAPIISKIILSKEKLNLEVNKSSTLSVMMEPDNASKTVQWSSNDPTIASVDATGNVTAHKAGVTIVKASVLDKSANCEVRVYKVEEPVLPPPVMNNGKDTTIAVNEKTKETLSNELVNVITNLDDTTAISMDTKQALKDAIADGKEITINAETTKVDAKTVDREVIKKIEKVITKEATIAQYFDLSMMLKAEGTNLGTLNELTGKASFTITVPNDLAIAGRTFYMVRIHNGIAEKIEGTLNGTNFSFETDKFSLYALVYEDVSILNTGDDNDLEALYAGLSLSLFAIITYMFKKKFLI